MPNQAPPHKGALHPSPWRLFCKHRGKRVLHPVLTFSFLLMFLLQICAAPAHAFLGLGSFGIKDEKEMGRKFEVLIRSQLPLVEDPEVSQYVKYIVNRLSKGIPPQPFDFTSGVILHNSLNAFAVPGGHVFVFTGLMMNMDNEAELAGVLAHELAHVTQRHVASRIERGKLMTIGSLLLAIAGIAAGGAGGGALAAGALGAGQAAMLNYSRVDENESDHVGYQYLIAAGYPPEGMMTGFQKIRKKSWMSGSNMPAYLSTHPELADRVNSIQARIQSAPASVRNRSLDNSRFLRVKTLLWARYGDYDTALQMFSSQKPNNCLALMGKGIVYSRQNKIAEAGAAFDKALACGPNDALVSREAGIFHFRKGDMQRAEGLLRKAMQKDSSDYMARFFYARLLDETGRLTQAHPYYEDVLRSIPEDQEVHTAYGRSLGESGKTFDAFLHLAYSALYGNEKKRTEKYFAQAKAQVKKPEQQRLLDRFNTRYEERKEIWKQGM